MKKLIIIIVRFYQKHISKIVTSLGIQCKYYPSCSEYMIQAIEKYGVCKGGRIGLIRLLKCNPFSKGGYDPLK